MIKNIILVITILATAAVITSCKQKTTTQIESKEMQRADMQYAYKLLEKNNNMEAARIFEQVIASNPQNSRAYIELAIIYHQTNDFIEAMYYYKKYGSLRPNSEKFEMVQDQLSLAKKEFVYLENQKAARRKKPQDDYEWEATELQTLKEQNVSLTEQITSLTNTITSLEKTVASQAKVLRSRASEKEKVSEYTISKGENLRGIAVTLFGDEDKWKFLYEYNKDRLNLKTPNNIQPGQILIIPWENIDINE
ncbi:MAG: LysM peptidoglycan-binding domain-containing protein [Kiritimatiellae bacterium]|jgi:tetratricopeptide (TPR) repeat protein|nr:LysM peptidoglycan-binding domain-containing protein [Kiritimatiellia bacterium]